MMNLASIDIGSNGARLLIKRFDPEAIREEDRIKKLMFIRIPLRLGKDVFTLGKVSKEREKMMLHMMKGFKQFTHHAQQSAVWYRSPHRVSRHWFVRTIPSVLHHICSSP